MSQITEPRDTGGHTPGPWVVRTDYSGAFNLFGEGGNRVILCQARMANQDQNVQLISAAPDLLEALQLVRDWVVTLKGNNHPYQIAIDVAIAKATGSAS